MIAEVSIRCQKTPKVGIHRIPAYTPPPIHQYADTQRIGVSVAIGVQTAANCISIGIDMPFAMWIRRDPRTRVLDGNADWRQLANTMDLSRRGGDG